VRDQRPNKAKQEAEMRTSVTEFDKAIISRQPDFDERKTRANFRKVIPNLKTVVIHCFGPRVTSGIPYAVAKALPA
jgi:carbonic anhydrase